MTPLSLWERNMLDCLLYLSDKTPDRYVTDHRLCIALGSLDEIRPVLRDLETRGLVESTFDPERAEGSFAIVWRVSDPEQAAALLAGQVRFVPSVRLRPSVLAERLI
jgi:transcription initiation factor IIE alpha subunit